MKRRSSSARRRNPALSAFTVKPSRFGPVYVLNVPAKPGHSGVLRPGVDRGEWEAEQAHYFILSPFGGVYSLAGGLGKHAKGTHSTLLGRGSYATPDEAAAALDAYIPKGAGNFIHRNPARKNPVIRTLRATVPERVARAKREILADLHAPQNLPRYAIKSFTDLHDYVDANGYGGFFEDKGKQGEKWGFRGSEADVRVANAVQDALDAWIKAGGLRRAERAPKGRATYRRNPDPLAYGPGPIPPRVAQAAAAILGWAETERIVGPGLLSGASGYDMRRLVHAAKVERERQGGPAAIKHRKSASR